MMLDSDKNKPEYKRFESALRKVLSAPKELGKKNQTKPKTKKPKKKPSK